MHGVGANYIERAFKMAKFQNPVSTLQITYRSTYLYIWTYDISYIRYKIDSHKLLLSIQVMVAEQKNPDPDFPTAPFPNPEEGSFIGTVKNGSSIEVMGGMKWRKTWIWKFHFIKNLSK